MQDIERAREVYKACIKLIPHKQFSFAKIWTMFAKFEIRQHDLAAARKILGQALGVMKQKDKIYAAYIQLELQLGEVERCRKLYGGFLAYNPTNCHVLLCIFASPYIWCRRGQCLQT